LRDDFLSPAERSFFGVLTQVVGNRYTVLAKVRLADLLYVPRSGNSKWASQQNKINQKHVDFLLCEPSTMAPVLAVELDDASHARPARAVRDAFVDGAFASSGLPLARIPVQNSYAAGEVGRMLQLALGADGKPTSSTASREGAVPAAETESVPKCPKCGADMVLRTAVKGPHKGEQFYGCSQFPKCHGVVPLKQTSQG
jgi:predicted RNA-binding Zn-ribbon protein involved in translation (DUF1610 family)